MLFPGIFKQVRVSIILQIWHLDFTHFLLPVMVGVVEILVLTSICLRLGGCLYAQSVVLLNKCSAALRKHVYTHMYTHIYTHKYTKIYINIHINFIILFYFIFYIYTYIYTYTYTSIILIVN